MNSAPLVVSFLHVGPTSKIAQIMVASVKASMPHAEIVQMTDQDTAPVRGVDKVIRKRWDKRFLMVYRLLHLKDFPASNTIFLDTDVVVQKDLSHIFDENFDICLTKRYDIIRDPTGYNLAEEMPYNTGVMFSKPSGWPFWNQAYENSITFPKEDKEWWGDQVAIKKAADVTTLNVIELPCDLYNYTPRRQDEDLSEKFVVHYKGARKEWMLKARIGERS